MKPSIWWMALAALVLAASGCEQDKTPKVAPSGQQAAEERKATTPEEKTSLPVVNEKVEKEASAPAAPATPAAPSAPAPAAPAPPKGAPVAPSAAASPATPKSAAAAPPQKVTYDASYGQVTFDHQKHSGSFPCSSCHAADPPEKIALGKDKAHQMCKGCHQERGAGPTQCNGCHKKG